MSSDTWWRGLLVAVSESMWFLQVPALRVVGSGKGLEYAGLRGARTAPWYGAARIPVLPHFLVSEEIGLQSQRSWGYRSFGGFDFGFGCLEFFGCPEISFGDWREAVSRLAAPWGLDLGHL